LPTNDGKGNANHGLVYNRKFQILEQTESSVIYSYRLGEDHVYPFEVEIVVSYELNSSGFTSRIGAINHGSATAPVAFGTHPYFMAFPDSKVTISAGKQSVSNEFQIPTGSEPATKVTPDRYSQMKLDDCFFELVRDENGVAETTVSNPDGTYFSVWQDTGFPYLTVFTHPNLGLAIEPQSSPANALNSGEGLALLETGAETFGTWGIKVGSGK
jgi:aldose 1-epimerase